MPSIKSSDPLELVKASPAAVRQRDKPGWLALFTRDAFIEDPVGAATYRGHKRLSSFWDVFIAPQEQIVFHPRRDLVAEDRVVRHVTIETLTSVSSTPLQVEAILQYRLQGQQIASMRAFWQPTAAVRWYLGRGLSGVTGLLHHGGRMTWGLGLPSALAFGQALRPALSATAGRRIIHQLVSAPQAAWMTIVQDAQLQVAGVQDTGTLASTPAQAWAHARGEAPVMVPESIRIAGDHVAAILNGEDRTAAIIARVEHRRIVKLEWTWS